MSPGQTTLCRSCPHTAYLQVDSMLDVIVVRHRIRQTDCVAWEERVPALHDEQLLGYYHLQAGCVPDVSPACMLHHAKWIDGHICLRQCTWVTVWPDVEQPHAHAGTLQCIAG